VETNEKIALYLIILKRFFMKKLSILLALTGFSIVASAQQNDFFDIQKHLQKKKKENKPVHKPFLLKPPFQNQFDIFQSGKANSQSTFSYVLPNGDKVNTLTQDNMPCIVPDMSQFNTINVFGLIKQSENTLLTYNIPGSIPNAAIPKRIFFSK
jgi:hypothetical protein